MTVDAGAWGTNVGCMTLETGGFKLLDLGSCATLETGGTVTETGGTVTETGGVVTDWRDGIGMALGG
jgi:hypothetical protein